MNLNGSISLNNITDLLRELADCHKMIKDFEIGEEAARGYSDKESRELKYPYLWVDYGPTNLNINQRRVSDKTYNLRLFVADKHYDNEEKKIDDEIMSDTEGILSDVVQYILTNKDLKRVMINDGVIQMQPAREETKDDVFGWFAVVPIRIPYQYCASELPIEQKAL